MSEHTLNSLLSQSKQLVSENARSMIGKVQHKRFVSRRGKIFQKLDLQIQEQEKQLTRLFPSKSTTLQVKGRTFGKPFVQPHANLSAAQKEVVRELFRRIRASYIPEKVFNLLEHVDAFQAVQKFLDLLGVSYDSLFEKNSQERVFFDDVSGALAEAEMFSQRESLISDAPVYRVLSTHNVRKVNLCVEHMYKVVNVIKWLRTDSIIAPSYQNDFYNRAFSFIEQWDRTEDLALSEFYEEYLHWRNLQHAYDVWCDEFERIVYWVYENISRPKQWSDYTEFKQLENHGRNMQQKLKQGKIEPEQGVREFQNMLQQLQTLVAKQSAFFRDGQTQESLAHVSKCLKALELSPHHDHLNVPVLKNAFRSLALQSHPGISENHRERFIEITNAYHSLRTYLEVHARN